ncbi:AraC family transcriptional regulator [Sphingomonas sp. SUN039]|uniref:helix-turn-helix transcriptional regulator n=1 Tax=Sphingomonas sp. SUN039 TaxID=2937787 RepID=UPI0021645602|nr:AraC family transcriptional regulator [Sphingomonas sp. SUN039]UVO52635.1 helix-turn-helix transcriptional regulator [Sphingomonas sp. SUN039]
MAQESFGTSVVEAELAITGATVQIVRFHLDEPTNRIFHRDDHYWLDLCLSPRPEKARGCYSERWGPHRFERLGDILLLPPGETLHIRTDGQGEQISVVCEIERRAIDRWLGGGIEWTDRRLAASLDIVHPHIRSCLFRLAGEARQPGAGSDILTKMIAGQLAIDVARYCQAIAEGPITGGLASWRLRLIDRRLERPGPMPTLGELAEHCALSVRQLTRGFQSSRGCTIGEHIAHTRIEMAKRQLGSDDSIKGIAFGLGFASPSSFAYAFRRATGITPRQFRQRQMGKRG